MISIFSELTLKRYARSSIFDKDDLIGEIDFTRQRYFALPVRSGVMGPRVRTSD